MILNRPFLLLIVWMALLTIAITGCRSSEKVTRPSPSEVESPAEESAAEESEVRSEPDSREEIPAAIPTDPKHVPGPMEEFRGVWVATVANIDWPSRPGLTVQQQREELIRLLNRAAALNFNAVIFQVRPSADAFYDSPYEPWSYYLTGEMGRSPLPEYDPLEFAIEEAHKRGLALHAWFNPYRATHPAGNGELAENHISRTHPELVVKYGNHLWLDPGNEEAREHTIKVILDIVKRYDIDGVHFDDYFYPYASYNGGADFPDYASWQAYKRKGGQLSRADWRRENVNSFIKRVYEGIKAEKNHVKFGLSPFGIWKPGYPSGITGSSQYDELYADAKLWLNKGWVDYFAPQLYWPIHPARQSFTALLQWWSNENTHKRHLWPGINTVRNKNLEHSAEIVRQIEATRKIVPESKGVVHWSISGLTKNPHMTNAVYQNVYSKKALVPRTPWLNANPLLSPTLLLTKQENIIFTKWLHKQPHEVFQWILYYQYGEEWGYEILKGTQTEKELPLQKNGKHLRT